MPDLLRQANAPLFPKVLWDKPINKKTAKRMLIIGGHASEFSKTQMAYQEAVATGIGEAKVVLPDSVYKLTGNLPDCLFVPSTLSGSIAKAAVDEIFRYVEESDGVLLPGELSHNTETVGALELLMRDCAKPLIVNGEVIEMMLYEPNLIYSHSQRLLIAGTQTYAKLAGKLELTIKIANATSLMAKVNLLSELASSKPCDYVLSGHEAIVLSKAQTSATNTPKANFYGDGVLATFWLQHPNKFEALTTAAYVLSNSKDIADIQKVVTKLSA